MNPQTYDVVALNESRYDDGHVRLDLSSIKNYFKNVPSLHSSRSTSNLRKPKLLLYGSSISRYAFEIWNHIHKIQFRYENSTFTFCLFIFSRLWME